MVVDAYKYVCLYYTYDIMASKRQYVQDSLPISLCRLLQISAKRSRLVSVPPLSHNCKLALVQSWLPPSEVARKSQEKDSSWMLRIFASGLQRRAYLTCGQDHTWSWQMGNKKLQLPGVFCLGCGLNYIAWIFSNPWTVFSLCTHIFFHMVNNMVKVLIDCLGSPTSIFDSKKFKRWI